MDRGGGRVESRAGRTAIPAGEGAVWGVEKNPIASVNWAQFEPFTGIPAVAPGNVTPYAEDYLLSVERELGHGTVFDVSYAGTQAHHLLTLRRRTRAILPCVWD